ncbi:unnamed protein product [Schistocephalus solidus]|uniref:Uncharacterized protein n=1 Tax=Schistocephalus solidus TaxID=70667 RepID=A0A183TMV6_SCHSO|nr:unnamed protein product [Schistocephalus solidus]
MLQRTTQHQRHRRWDLLSMSPGNFAELCFGPFLGRPMSSSACADLISSSSTSSSQNGIFGASAANSLQHPHQHSVTSCADLKAKKARHR